MIELTSIFALLWAGIAIGGNLIAAPAKFGAPSLELPVALEVGRAQFKWVAIGEGLVALSGLIMSFVSSTFTSLWLFLPAALFAMQWRILMPRLQANSAQRVRDPHYPSSRIHILYVAIEIIKIVALMSIAVSLREVS